MAADSVVEQLRTLDGELFKSEVVLRMYLALKTHAIESLRGAFQSGSKDMYATVLKSYAQWTTAVREEEITALKRTDSLDALWLQVAVMYVKQSYRSSDTDAVSVRIKTPELEEFVQAFYKWVVRAPGCASGELWSQDPIRLDFAMREAFRCALMDSIHVLHVEKVEDDVGPEDSVSHFGDDDDATTVVSVKSVKSRKEVASGSSVVKSRSVVSHASRSSQDSKTTKASRQSRLTPAKISVLSVLKEESVVSAASAAETEESLPPVRFDDKPKVIEISLGT